jgi:sigma-B regulation protein RsbU (phosphoserine phosphatase)
MDINQESADLALAAELQAAMLPKAPPTDFPNQAAAARNRMCGTVGGDFYDFIRINEDQAAVVIGDVVGHGVRSSLVMAKIMGWLRSRPPNSCRPAQIITDLNRMLVELGDKTNSVMICSLFYAVLDMPSGIAFFVNAGHPRPFLCDGLMCAQQVPCATYLGARNMLLGVQEFDPQEDCHTFTPGQRLVLYTDGITDAGNGTPGDYFGEKRLLATSAETSRQPPQQCADAIFNAVQSFRNGARQEDDETVVVIDRL